ncbi:MAG: hypothetical protein E6I80_14085 [Chloroflexi bacterium]|nr:MAG: hypothetical protein E6I80_14085 [Chloroflexota bacterium]
MYRCFNMLNIPMFDVHITFPLTQFHAMLAAFGEQFEAQHDTVVLLDCGASQKQAVGYLVLEWTDEVDEAFIQQLTSDPNVVDFSIFTVPCSTDDPPFSSFTFAEEGEPL